MAITISHTTSSNLLKVSISTGLGTLVGAGLAALIPGLPGGPTGPGGSVIAAGAALGALAGGAFGAALCTPNEEAQRAAEVESLARELLRRHAGPNYGANEARRDAQAFFTSRPAHSS